MNLIVAITGATGVVLGTRLLEILGDLDDVKSYLILSEWGARLIESEVGASIAEVSKMADFMYDNDDLEAPVSSGSFSIDGMVIIPCTMDTMASIALGFSNDLISRAASVTLKEGRKLVLVVRETPLSPIHLRNMMTLSQAGAVILPPVLTFYHNPKGIDDLVDHIVGRVFEQFQIDHDLYSRWGSKEGGRQAGE